MHQFLALLLILSGLGGIGYGVATATILRASGTVIATATPRGDGTMVVTDPGVLGLVDDQVTIQATVPEGQKVTLALGSETDVLGWVGDDPYDAVTGLSSWESLTVVPGHDEASGGEESESEKPDKESAKEPEKKESDKESEKSDETTKAPDPAGSDMWISEVSDTTSVSMRWTEEPGRVVLLAAGVGKDAEPPTLVLTWPRSVETPFLWPGVLGGGLALILGIFLAIGVRRGKKHGRGTRRRTLVRSHQPHTDLSHDSVADEDSEQPHSDSKLQVAVVEQSDPTPGGTAVLSPLTAKKSGLELDHTESDQSGVRSPAEPIATGKPLTRRELRLREQSQRQAEVSETSVVPTSEATETDAEEAPTILASTWRKTWGFIGESRDNS